MNKIIFFSFLLILITGGVLFYRYLSQVIPTKVTISFTPAATNLTLAPSETPAPSTTSPVVIVPTDIPTQSPTTQVATKSDNQVQVLKATYSNAFGFQPKQLTAKAGVPIRLEVASRDNGEGCMGSISLPQLSNDYYGFEAGKTVTFNVTPPGPGEYAITCAMGLPHGTITVK